MKGMRYETGSSSTSTTTPATLLPEIGRTANRANCQSARLESRLRVATPGQAGRLRSFNGRSGRRSGRERLGRVRDRSQGARRRTRRQRPGTGRGTMALRQGCRITGR